jgi:Ca2+:H+ antiporter
MYAQESKKVAIRPRRHAIPKGSVMKGLAVVGGIRAVQGQTHAADKDRPLYDELF